MVAVAVSCKETDPLTESATVLSDQLSSPHITCFLQDPSGRMWIGTERGLNRYNGYDYHQYFYRADSVSLPGNHIYDLCLDKGGHLWVGTEKGVARYTDLDSFECFPIASEEKPVYQILCDSRGQIILNMLEDLCVLDTLSGTFTNRVYLFDRYYSYRSHCYLSDDGLLWVVSPMEIRCFDTEDFQNIDNYPTPSFVTESVLLGNGQIWMAGRRKMCIFDTVTQSFVRMPSVVTSRFAEEEIEFMAEVDSSSVMFKTSSGLMCLYDRHNDILQDITPETLDLPVGFDVKVLHKDNAGNLWLGSDDRGFDYIRMREGDFSKNALSRRALENKSVVSVCSDTAGNLWAFTLRDGLYRMDHGNGEVVKVTISGVSQMEGTDVLQSNPPLVFVSSDDEIWLSFPNQQRVFRGRYLRGEVRLENEFPAFYPRAATEDSEGGVWFGTRDEFLINIAPGASAPQRVQIYPVETTFINSILPVGDSLLVLAYDEPPMLLDIHTRSASRIELDGKDNAISMSGRLLHPTVAKADTAGNIWIGTRFNGLLKYNPENKSIVSIKDVPADVASIEITPSGQIWVSTADGLAYSTNGGTQFSNFLPLTGKGGEHFYERSSGMLPDGRLVFGGVGGITIVDASDPAPVHGVPLVFEDIKVHNVPVAPGNRIIDRSLSFCPDIELLYRENSFSVSFSVPDFSNRHRVQYQYKLDGFDRDWVDLGTNRDIYFANIPAGEYVLRVRHYLLSDDVMGEERLTIRVKRPVWLSGWAQLIYLLLTGLLVFLVVRVKNQIDRQRAAARDAEKAKEQERLTNELNMAFFSNVSHEFRTPLTMISGPLSQLSGSRHLNRQERALVSMMGRNVNRMLSLVNQLLDISKMEHTAIGLKVRKTDIVRVLEDTVDSFRFNAKALCIEIATVGMENPVIVWCDEDKIRKILSNLISNAIKFSRNGGAISVALSRVNIGEEPEIRITVTDSGEGIPEDKLEKIFERYYQLDNQPVRPYGVGTGIGLFYARQLANIHHGSLKAGNRTDGHGAVFTLLIPENADRYRESEKVEVDAYESSLYSPFDAGFAKNADAKEESRPRLLAIDDNPDVLQYLRMLFDRTCLVVTAMSASEAENEALDHTPDIILCDVAMPDKSGYDLCHEFKSNLQLSHIPIILVTAMSSVDNQVTGLNMGADAYVSKPFDPSYLKALVKSLLDNRKRVQTMMGRATDTSEVGSSLSVRDKAFMDQLYELMEQELSNEDMDITTLCDILRISRTKLYYKIKALTGMSPSEFFLQYKLNRAAEMLHEGKLNVTEIAIRTGFGTLPSFSKAFKKRYGVSPSKY